MYRPITRRDSVFNNPQSVEYEEVPPFFVSTGKQLNTSAETIAVTPATSEDQDWLEYQAERALEFGSPLDDYSDEELEQLRITSNEVYRLLRLGNDAFRMAQWGPWNEFFVSQLSEEFQLAA
jgi:hypothetical protein